MRLERRITRGGLLASAGVAIVVPVVALREVGARNPDAWATLAAVLAVVAAAISAWTTQRVTELQEDALEPNSQPSIDARSRYGLVQFRIINKGQTSAHDITVSWTHPLRAVGSEIVTIGDGGSLPVLLPGETASVLLGESSQFFQQFANTNASGTLTFSNASGVKVSRSFVVTAEHERAALRHDREDPKTQYELQRIPATLEKIATEIGALREELQQNRKTSDNSA